MSGRLEPRDQALLAEHPDVPIMDTSTRRLFKRCPRKAAWMAAPPLGRGLRPKTVAPALMFGTLIHEALDHYYEGVRSEWGPDILPGEFFASRAAKQIEEAQRGGKLFRPAQDQLDDLHGMQELGVSMLDEYTAFAEQYDDFKVLVTERGALIPVPQYKGGSPVALYYVRFDGIVEDESGRLWVMEHKTTQRWWDETRLALDEQISAYAWAAQKWYGRPIAGVLMNFLLKERVRDPFILKSGLPSTDWGKLTYVTAERYAGALAHRQDLLTDSPYSSVIERLQARDAENGHPTIRRVKVELTPERIRQQEARILSDTLRMIDPNRPGVESPSPDLSCSWCPMREPCLLMEEGSDYEWALEHGYEEVLPIWGGREDTEE